MLYLDSDQRLIQVGEYGDGGASPRTILSEALRLGAVGIIIGRNHPSGDSAPSETDVEAARELADMGRSLGIRLFDQLIFAGDETRSFRALGLL